MKTYSAEEIIANNVSRLDDVHEADECWDECDSDFDRFNRDADDAYDRSY